MESLYTVISQNEPILWVILIVAFILLIFFIIRTRKRMQKIVIEDIYVPANIWFYSKLVNMELEIEKVSYKNLLHCFYNYLCKKYHIYKEDLKQKTIFEIVSERETDQEQINFYGEIWNSIEDLKQKKSDEVIQYIKSIKLYFNKEDLQGWISARKKLNKPCNDC